MLSNAGPPFDGFLRSILTRAAMEQEIVRGIGVRELRGDDRMAYAVAYALIRVGNSIAEHSRQLEVAYPGYHWVFWVDMRNRLAHRLGALDVNDLWEAASEYLPELIQSIAGEPPTP